MFFQPCGPIMNRLDCSGNHVEISSMIEPNAASRNAPCTPFSMSGRPVLRDLVADLELACMAAAEAVPERVQAAVARHCAGVDWLLPDERAGSSDGYCRHILHADPHGRFTVVALVWLAGQVTPVHAHYTWCVYRVLSGVLMEDRYDWTGGATGQACWRASVERGVGTSGHGHGGLEQVHRLRHLAGSPAISLHVYGIDVGRVASHVNRRPARVVHEAMA